MSSKTERQSIGIDLGTTYSTVAYINDVGQPETIANASGENLTPSAICIDEGSIVVGRQAIKASAFLPEQYFECFKREMGEKKTFQVNGVSTPAEVLSAVLLERLKQDAEKRIGNISNVVITVPAYFDESRRQSTVIAANLAGLRVIEIINEPTSAAVAFGFQSKNEKPVKLLVYDLGGGTFDVSILQVDGDDFTTLGTDGDVRLGGKDFDERIVNFLAEEFEKVHGVDPRLDSNDLAQLWLDAEELKKSLSELESVPYVMHFSGLRHRTKLTREKFESLTQDLLRRTLSTVELLLRDSEMAWDQIDDILLIGGSSRIPSVASMLADASGKTPNSSVNPDLAVGHGAALLCHSLVNGSDDRINLINVNSHSLGVVGKDPQTKRKFNKIVIPKNTPIPFSVTKTFVTGRDGQTSVLVKVVEGESRRPEECSMIGQCTVRNLPPDLPKGTKVKVHFAYDTCGRLAVSARVPSTRQSATTVIERNTIVDLGDLATWKAKFTGAPEVAASNNTRLLKRLDEVLAEIANGDSGKQFPDAPEIVGHIANLRKSIKGMQSDFERMQKEQATSANRLMAMRMSGELAKTANSIKSLEIELEFAVIDLGRQIVETKSESSSDSALAIEARDIIEQLDRSSG